MTGEPHRDEVPPEPPGGSPLAAEVALGLLDPAARAEAESRLARDPGFAAEVAAWQHRLAPLLAEVKPVAAPPRLWGRIAAAIGTSPATGQARSEATGRPGLWRSLSFWRWATAGSLGLAAACLAALVVGVGPAPPPLVATLASAGGRPALSALVEPGGRSLLILPASLEAEGRVPELWLVPPGGEPRSLGIIEAGRPARVPLPPDLSRSARSSAALAVSLEPAGGSPTGRPTGPVIAQGILSEL